MSRVSLIVLTRLPVRILVEQLTDEIEKQAIAYIHKIDEMGGALSAIDQGYIQNEIQKAAYTYQKDIEAKRKVIVGINEFQIDEKQDLERLKVDSSSEQAQVGRLTTYKKNRDQQKVADNLTYLESSAKSDANLMPVFIQCVEGGLTLGEITGVLKKLWGEYQPPSFS